MKPFSFIIILAYLFSGCGSDSYENELSATGTIESINITISSKTAGEINEMRFSEGQRISKGDTLLLIDNESLTIQLAQAEAAVEMSQAQLDMLKAGARSEDVKQAESLLKQAELNRVQAESDFNRTKNLFESGSVSKKQMEDVQTRFEVAQAQFFSAEENMGKIKNLARPEEVRQYSARLRQAVSNKNLIEKNIRDSYIISPASGFIVEKYFEEGETVSSMSSLLKIADLSKVELYIYIPETELGKINFGNKAEVYVDSYPGKAFEGKVVYISPEAEFTPKNIQTKDERTKLVFAVKIELQNPDYKLKPGMPADAFVKLKD